MRARPLAERFWEKVERHPSGCWLWTGALCGKGYGAIRADRARRSLRTHRASYEMANGPIPDGLHVLHRCDNPRCVNPAHLFLGTHQENMDDRARKGRKAKTSGVANGRSKITDETVRKIRAATGFQAAIGAQYGVSQTTVWKIKRGHSWGHVT